MTRKIYFFTVLAALFLLASTSLRAESSGKCGDNVTWTLDDQGVLTIEGTGAMTDYDWDCSPFPSLSPKKVVIKGGVTTIGTYAFDECMGLASVEISGSVTSIGGCAFSGCKWITSLTLPESLTTIGGWAFNDCMDLTSITIPAAVTSIGERAFSGCTGLTKIESLAQTPPTCGANVFSNVDMSKCVLYVPKKAMSAYKAEDQWKDFTNTVSSAKVVSSGSCGSNVTWSLDDEGELTIEGTGEMSNYEYMTSPFTSLSFTTAVIKDGVTTIGEYVFAECQGMTSVEIPSSVEKIGTQAFTYAKGLTSVTIPSAVTSIGEQAFIGCSGLTKFECLAETPPTCGSLAFYNVDKSKCTLYVPENSISAYKGKDQWKDFTNIEALSGGTQSGKCGDNVTWTLDSDGVLTIEGTGAMSDYGADDAPWRDLSFTTAVIKDGVTTIGNSAFERCAELTSITISNSVKTIGEYAFNGSTGLTSVDIPNSVTNIGEAAFTGCYGLTSVTIPNSVESIGEYVFYGCYGLTSVAIPNSVISIGQAAFAGCTGLTSVDIPNSVKNIGEHAFENCPLLSSVTIPNSVESIGQSAFSGCTGLTSVTIPNSVTSIGEAAFYECAGLTSVTIPSSVKNIGYEAFSGCTGLTKIESLAEYPPTCGGDVFYNVDKTKCVLSVPEKSVNTYKDAPEWGDFTTIEALAAKVVASGNCGDNATWTLDSEGVLTIKGTGAMSDYNEEAPKWKDLSFTKAVIGNGITKIGNYAFDECEGLTSVEIPSSVEKIGECAFYDCTGLMKIETLAENPPTCDSYTFHGVDKNNCMLTVPEKSMDKYQTADGWSGFINTLPAKKKIVADGSCGDNATWTLDDQGVLTIEGTGAMTDYTYGSPAPWASLSFTTAVIGDGVTTIGNYAFQDCSKLKSVEILGSVTSIGERAFRFCAGLTSVNFPSSLTKIGKNAFHSCSGLEKIESLAENPPTCGDEVFYNVDKSKCVLTVPKKSIDKYKEEDQWKDFYTIEAVAAKVVASGDCGDNVKWSLDSDGVLTFAGTGNMTGYSDGAPWMNMTVTQAVIGDGITNIGNKLFLGCTGLTSVTIPGSVTSIGEAVFYNCQKLTSVEIPNTVTSIGAAAFACTGLTSVTIPASVTSIGEVAFYCCAGLESITVDPENSTYNSQDNCNAIIETETNTLIAGCKNTTIPNTVTSIGRGAFASCTGLTSVTIPASVTSIGEQAFSGCTGLSKIESLAENPPACATDAFTDVNKNTCVLTVPKKAVNDYKSAAVWKEFTNTVSGISGAAQENSAAVSASNGEITVTGAADNAVVEVYNTSGTLVYRGTGKTVAVPSAGVYIVRTVGSTFKVNTAR